MGKLTKLQLEQKEWEVSNKVIAEHMTRLAGAPEFQSFKELLVRQLELMQTTLEVAKTWEQVIQIQAVIRTYKDILGLDQNARASAHRKRILE